VVNEVLYEYDTNGLLSKDYSNPSGSVSVSTTPYIAYTYDTTASGGYFTKRLRPTTMKYPGGKVLTYVYGTTGSSDDLLSRYTAIKDGTTDVVTYPNNNTVSYPQPGLTLDYTSGQDRFNRVIDHAWKKSTTDVVRIKHDYDRVGNRLYREDTVGTNFSEVYTYDGVNQLIDMQRGVLNSTKNGVTTKTGQEQFAFDATGNWGTYRNDTNGNGTWDLNQSRTHNKANEIVTIAGSAANVALDRNGNMTKLPKPDSWSAAFTTTFDAWNRLVKVQDGTTVVATYSYNGLNHRVRKVVGSTTTLSVFNQSWQELESAVGGVTTAYVWGLRYIDDLVYRDKGEERLYSIADPNWNIVAITNASGTVQERMKYDAFGKVTWLDANFGNKAASAYGWSRIFTGQVFDSETWLMLYRNRFYHTGLGRFVTRDPIGYDSGDVSLYRYVGNMPGIFVDIYGLQGGVALPRRDSRQPPERIPIGPQLPIMPEKPTLPPTWPGDGSVRNPLPPGRIQDEVLNPPRNPADELGVRPPDRRLPDEKVPWKPLPWPNPTPCQNCQDKYDDCMVEASQTMNYCMVLAGGACLTACVKSGPAYPACVTACGLVGAAGCNKIYENDAKACRAARNKCSH